MKNFKLMTLVLLAVTLIFSSCSKDEEATIAAPTIAFQNGNDALTFSGSESIDVRVDFTAEGKIESLKLTGDGSVVTLTEAEGETTFEYTFKRTTAEIETLLATSTDDPKTATYTFTLIDKEGNTKTATYTVTAAATAGAPIDTYTAKLMGAQDNATKGSFFASTTGMVYLTNDANSNSALIDIIYYYGSLNDATLCAPNDETVNGGTGFLSLATGLTTQNATTFTTTSISTSTFDAMTDDTGFDAITTFPNTKLTTLSQDDVIAFKTAAGKIGLLKVSSITTGDAGSMTINVKVQQ